MTHKFTFRPENSYHFTELSSIIIKRTADVNSFTPSGSFWALTGKISGIIRNISDHFFVNQDHKK